MISQSTCRAAALLGSLALIVAACSTSSASGLPSGVPQRGAAPTVSVTKTCIAPRSVLPRRNQRPHLDTDPVGVTAQWFAGSTRTLCSEPITTGGSALAHRMVHDIAGATPWGPGTYSCPEDQGAAVRLYFRYAERADADIIDISLQGCTAIKTSTRSIGLHTDTIAADLATITPADLAHL
jgi:hypothetical protein